MQFPWNLRETLLQQEPSNSGRVTSQFQASFRQLNLHLESLTGQHGTHR